MTEAVQMWTSHTQQLDELSGWAVSYRLPMRAPARVVFLPSGDNEARAREFAHEIKRSGGIVFYNGSTTTEPEILLRAPTTYEG